MSPEKCLRCPDVALRPLPESTNEAAFYGCPACNRQCTNGPGQSLHDRWLSPRTIPLYAVIFEEHPEHLGEQVATDVKRQQSSASIDQLIADIEEELNDPKQRVSEMHDFLFPVEERLRSFLAE